MSVDKARAKGLSFQIHFSTFGVILFEAGSYWLEISLRTGPSSPIIMRELQHDAHTLLDRD